MVIHTNRITFIALQTKWSRKMTLIQVLDEYDIPEKKFYERELASILAGCEEIDKKSFEFLAESMAFNLYEDFQTNEKTDKHFYQPLIKVTDKQGKNYVSANHSNITPEIIAYWEKRIIESRNSILKARYAGLVWYFKKDVCNVKPDIKTAYDNLDALLDIITKDGMPTTLESIKKAEIALALSKSIKHGDYLLRAKKALKNLAVDAQDMNIGIWAAPFRMSMDHPGCFTVEERNELAESLQARFDKIFTCSHDNPFEHEPNPWLLMELADALSEFYSSNKRKDLIQELYRKVKASFDALIPTLSKLQIVSNLTNLYSRYQKFMPKGELDSLNEQIKLAGKDIHAEMQTFHQEISIPQEEMKAFIDSILSEDVEKTFRLFSYRFTPQKEAAKREFEELRKKYPFVFMFPQVALDNHGRATSYIGNVDADMDGNLIYHISQRLRLDAVFLFATIEEGKKRGLFTSQNILTFLEKSTSISTDRLSIITRGLDAYFQEDYLLFIHILIPQIEAAIRNIIESNGIPIRKPSRNGNSFQLRILDEMFRDEEIQKCLTSDFANYLRILLTDNRGWNLRNDICHGIAEPDIFNRLTADRILHVLLCLGNYR